MNVRLSKKFVKILNAGNGHCGIRDQGHISSGIYGSKDIDTIFFRILEVHG
jgi:hypothetical protein